MTIKLEICCYSVNDALIAQTAGADRIELCSGRSDGGLTPSYGELIQAQQANFTIPIHPIVRPRGGDFCYNQREFNSMLNDIALIKELGFVGVVFGCLQSDGHIDLANMQKLVNTAQGLSITFHRAFDVCIDATTALMQLTDLGVARILTSGQQATAENGIDLIQLLTKQTQGPKIMAGCGVRSTNVPKFIEAGISELHASASKKVTSKMVYKNTHVNMGLAGIDEFTLYETDEQEIKKIISLIKPIR